MKESSSPFDAADGEVGPRKKTLTSATGNLRVETWEVSAADIGSHAAGWSVKKVTLHGGKQEDVEIIVVDNGRLGFTVCPTRGMGVLSAKMGGVYLGWNSPVKEVVHPRLINLQSRGGLGWLEGFNEWMVRCGLEITVIPASTNSSTMLEKKPRWTSASTERLPIFLPAKLRW